MSIAEQIDWLKQHMLDQVDAGMAGFTIESQVLQFARVVVNACVGKMDVQHALDMHDHLQETGALQNMPCTDRLQHVYDYYHQWMELELATRYA